MVIGVHLEPCRWVHQAHTSEEQLESESRPATERIPPYVLIGLDSTFWPEANLWHVATSLLEWLKSLDAYDYLFSLSLAVGHRTRTINVWDTCLERFKFADVMSRATRSSIWKPLHAYKLILRAWIFITRNKICCHLWQANTAPSWLWLWRGSENISRDRSTSSLELCPPFCFSDGDRGPKLLSVTSTTQYETFPHSRSDRHVCSI